jgi:fumarate reductase subunit C
LATETVRKPYVRRRSPWWWTKNPRYVLFQFRELSGAFVVLYAFLVLWQLWALRGGEDSYYAFLVFWYSRPMMILNAVILGFVVLHTVTWFVLTTKVPLFRIRGRPPPAPLVVGANVAIWIAVSVLIVKLLYGGF